MHTQKKRERDILCSVDSQAYNSKNKTKKKPIEQIEKEKNPQAFK